MQTQQLIKHETRIIAGSPAVIKSRRVRELSEQDFTSAIELLEEAPMRAVHLRGLIDDYGICHPALRGRLFGYYEDDRLVNLALLGHHILIYKEREGLAAFAEKAAETGASGHLILGPTPQVEEFWSHLQRFGRQTRLLSSQLWYVYQKPRPTATAPHLTLATTERLNEITDLQARLVEEESGRDPRYLDLEGFRQRVKERIRRQRTWVKMSAGKIIFKAELVCETPAAVYLESIWTHPDFRNQGIATSCVGELVSRFSFKKKAICLLVAPEEVAALHVYRRVGFVHDDNYQARFLHPLA